MVRVLYKKEIVKFVKYHLVLYIFVTALLMVILNSILGSGELVFSLLEFVLVGFGLSYTTTLYRKYSDPEYLKIIKLHGKSKFKVKLISFCIMISWLFILAITYFIIFLIFDYTGLIKSANAFGNGGPPIWRLEDWQDGYMSGFWYGFYGIVIIIFMVVFYSALLNNFIKSRILILGLNLLIIIYTLIFGGITNFEQHAADGYLTTEGYNWRTTLNFFIIPWSQVGVFGKVAWFAGFTTNTISSHLFYTNVNYWDYSQMGIYSNLIWSPYFTIITLAITPLILRN